MGLGCQGSRSGDARQLTETTDHRRQEGGTMRTASLAGVIVGTALTWAADSSAGQDKGKTAAAELAQRLAAASAAVDPQSVPLAEDHSRPRAHAILVFPKVTKAGPGDRRPVWRGCALEEGERRVAYYKTTGASFETPRPGGQRSGYAMFFMNAKAARAARQRAGLRGRCRPERRPGGRGHGEDHHDHHAQGRHLRVRLRTEGADGGPRLQGNKIAKITPK